MIPATVRERAAACGSSLKTEEVANMKRANGLFPLEATVEGENGLLESLCPEGDLVYLLSGRCGIYHCLLDIVRYDKKRVAYLPLYTCETVVAPFVKAGFALKFYPLDRNMRPVFSEDALDSVSLVSVCGYYGFSAFDRDFVRKCKARGLTVMEDMTHSVLSADGLDENCDYAAGSLRKWMGVACGGFALKRRGRFARAPMPPHREHLKLRYDAIERDDMELFWKGEMMLRRIFDDFGSDDESVYLMKHADFRTIRRKRRENYRTLLENVRESENLKVVFPVLDAGTVPSHFTVFAGEREKVRDALQALGVKTSVYWPQGPLIELDGQEDTRYIYDHVLSLPCDQRFSAEDMKFIAAALNSYR